MVPQDAHAQTPTHCKALIVFTLITEQNALSEPKPRGGAGERGSAAVSPPCPRPAPDPAAAPPLPPERPCRAAPPPAGGISSSAAAPRGPFFALPAAPMALCNGDTKVSAAAAGRGAAASPGPVRPGTWRGPGAREGSGTARAAAAAPAARGALIH